MRTSTPKKQSPTVDRSEYNAVMANWLKAITKLHKYYHQLVTCTISQGIIEQEAMPGNTNYAGKSLIDQVQNLIHSMQIEVIKLNQEMDQIDRFDSLPTTKKYDKLVNHTLRLTKLNDQAQTKLDLLKRSAS